MSASCCVVGLTSFTTLMNDRKVKSISNTLLNQKGNVFVELEKLWMLFLDLYYYNNFLLWKCIDRNPSNSSSLANALFGFGHIFHDQVTYISTSYLVLSVSLTSWFLKQGPTTNNATNKDWKYKNRPFSLTIVVAECLYTGRAKQHYSELSFCCGK